MTELKDVSDQNLQPFGLKAPSFPFLSTEPALIRILLFQPIGVVIADQNGVSVRDRDLMGAQMHGFLTKAAEIGPDIATCPEYSCTWEALVGSVEEGLFPGEGRLWVIGCEGVTREALRQYIQRMSNTCAVMFEDPTQEQGNFFDCICYLFRCANTDGQPVQAILIQPKTHAMGGEDYEYANLIKGTFLYRFGLPGKNRLVSLLCSDVLAPNFADDIGSQLLHETLVLHLQLNKNPSAATYRSYRELCCLENPRNSEVLCLNWASGTSIVDGGQVRPFINEPKTILFRSTEELKEEDEVIAANHRLGCYLSYWKSHRSAAFVFSPDAQLFYLHTSKPLVVGPGANALRTGPTMLYRYEWSDSNWNAATTDADDRFAGYWLDDSTRSVLGNYRESIVDVERLILFSVGKALDTEWDSWKELPSFRLESDDTSCRLSLCWAVSGAGYEFRDSCRRDFQGFVGIIDDSSQFSARLSAFKQAPFRVKYVAAPPFKRFRNLHSDEGGTATGVFLGYNPSPERLSAVKRKLLARLYETNEDPERMAIWYLAVDGTRRDYMDLDIPSIASDPNANPISIANPSL